MDNWLTIVLGVAAGSILAGWIHRLLNAPGRGPRSAESALRLDVRSHPAEGGGLPSRAADLRAEVRSEEAALKRAIVAWRKSNWRFWMWFSLLLAGCGLFMALPIAASHAARGEDDGAIWGVSQYIAICLLGAYVVGRLGSREVRRIRQRVLRLRELRDHEIGLPPLQQRWE